jgi:hypothetical protein
MKRMWSMSVPSYFSSCSPFASVPPDYEDDGAEADSKQPASPVPPPFKAKRHREVVEDSEDDRQRKRRKTDFTQATLVNPSQYNPFRDSPLSRAAASERAPSRGLMSPTRLPVLDFSKRIPTKQTPVRPLPVMDFTAGRANRRESVAQRVADQTFVLEHEADEDEEPEVVISSKGEGSPLLLEDEFGEVPALQAPKRQRKGKINLDLIPAVTYQSEITFFHITIVIHPFFDSGSNWRHDAVSIQNCNPSCRRSS